MIFHIHSHIKIYIISKERRTTYLDSYSSGGKWLII
jgi:hypothetical protein